VRRGSLLVVVLGLLTLLSLLVTSFASSALVERRVVSNHLDAVRARLAAQSGIEFAIDRLWQQAREGWFGEARWNDRGPPILIDGAPTFRTGSAGSTYAPKGDAYSVEVLDCQGRINVNDGVDLGLSHAVTQNLGRVLNRLGREAGVPGLGDRILAARPPGGFETPLDLIRAVGGDLALWRRFRDHVTVTSWRNPNVHMAVPLSAAVAADYPVRIDCPNGYRRGHGKDATGQEIDRRTRPWPLRWYEPRERDTVQSQPWYCAVWTLDSLRPMRLETAARSPVNVNTASRETLISLIDGLQGFFLQERRRPMPEDMFYRFMRHAYAYGPDESRRTRSFDRKGSELGYLYTTHPIEGAAVADLLVARRPFRTWREFHSAVDGLGLVDPRPIYFDYELDEAGRLRMVPSPRQSRVAAEAMADAIKANFNPNLHLNEENPDAPLALRVDKTDLIVQTTEFCFVPMGSFEIRSEGMILRETDFEFQCVARSMCVAVVQLYEPHSVTLADGALSPGLSLDPREDCLRLAAIRGKFGAPAVYASLGEGYYAEPLKTKSIHLAPFQKSFVIAFWAKPSWDPEDAGRMRVFFSAPVERDSRSGPLPWGLYFLPSWHGGEGEIGYGDPAPPASMLWAVGVRGRGGLGSVSSTVGRLRRGRWTHIAAGIDRNGTFLLIDGQEKGREIRVHMGRLPRILGESAGARLFVGCDLDRPTYGADAAIDQVHVWLDDDQGRRSAERQFEAGRYNISRYGDSYYAAFPIQFSGAGRVFVGACWTWHGPEKSGCRLRIGSVELENDGWSWIGFNPTEVRIGLDGKAPMFESACLDDLFLFISRGVARYVWYCPVYPP
jgi:hypothetical protein